MAYIRTRARLQAGAPSRITLRTSTPRASSSGKPSHSSPNLYAGLKDVNAKVVDQSLAVPNIQIRCYVTMAANVARFELGIVVTKATPDGPKMHWWVSLRDSVPVQQLATRLDVEFSKLVATLVAENRHDRESMF